MDSFEELKQRLQAFADERDWDQFHSPKNLAMALIVEAAELVEHFQWLTQAESQTLSAEQHSEVEQEIADIFIYLVRLADKLEIDLIPAAVNKIEINERKYPPDQARGSARKYTAYEP